MYVLLELGPRHDTSSCCSGSEANISASNVLEFPADFWPDFWTHPLRNPSRDPLREPLRDPSRDPLMYVLLELGP